MENTRLSVLSRHQGSAVHKQAALNYNINDYQTIPPVNLQLDEVAAESVLSTEWLPCGGPGGHV